MSRQVIGTFFNFLYKAGLCERRSFIRLYIKLPVTIIINKNKRIAGYIHNVSAGGVFIKTSLPIPITTDFELVFSLPDKAFSEPIYGRVAWQKHFSRFYETGIEFSRISEKDRDSIANFNFEKHLR